MNKFVRYKKNTINMSQVFDFMLEEEGIKFYYGSSADRPTNIWRFKNKEVTQKAYDLIFDFLELEVDRHSALNLTDFVEKWEKE